MAVALTRENEETARISRDNPLTVRAWFLLRIDHSMPYPGADTADDPGPRSGERRSVQRVEFEAEVSIAGDAQFLTGRVVNVSTHGVFVATERRLALGSPVVMQIALPDGEVFAKGHVRWITEGALDGEAGIGIEFEAPLPEPYARRITG